MTFIEACFYMYLICVYGRLAADLAKKITKDGTTWISSFESAIFHLALAIILPFVLPFFLLIGELDVIDSEQKQKLDKVKVNLKRYDQPQ